MADEVRISSQNPEGNGVKVDLREKKFALTGPNVALLMLIGIIGVVAYLRTGTIEKSVQDGQKHLAGVEERFQARVSELFGRMNKFNDDLQQQNVLLSTNNATVTAGHHELRTHFDQVLDKQNDLLRQQTQAIFDKMLTLEKDIERLLSDLGTRLEMLNWNMAHPDQTLPLRAPVPQEERQDVRGR